MEAKEIKRGFDKAVASEEVETLHLDAYYRDMHDGYILVAVPHSEMPSDGFAYQFRYYPWVELERPFDELQTEEMLARAEQVLDEGCRFFTVMKR